MGLSWHETRKLPMTQCVLRRDLDGDSGGHAERVDWIEPRLATVGTEVTVDSGDGPERGWFVHSVGVTKTKGWLWDHRSVLVEIRSVLDPRPKRRHRPSSKDAPKTLGRLIDWE